MDLDYRVELDTYSGPLDLLLYLVRRHEIDLNDIPIAHLTDQYLEHLELIKDVNMDQNELNFRYCDVSEQFDVENYAHLSIYGKIRLSEF